MEQQIVEQLVEDRFPADKFDLDGKDREHMALVFRGLMGLGAAKFPPLTGDHLNLIVDQGSAAIISVLNAAQVAQKNQEEPD